MNSKINSNKDKEEILTYISLYKDINILKEEFISITINIEKEEENNDIFLTYSQYSLLDEIIDEKLEPEKCQEIIKVFKELFEYYVYLDIAQNPPDIGIPNYHHRKINLIEEIGNIYIYNRTFYEFYQEILSILTVVKDFHISIVSTETPKGIQFYEYSAVLPLRYTIKSYNNEPRVFITIREEYIDKYDNYTQEMLRSHLDIPIKSINDMDPIDYIQNWSRFIVVKNIHSNFVQNLHYMAGFYMHYNPLNYSDFVANELEFDDNKIIRLSYYIIKPEINDAKFKQFFVENLKKYNNARYMPSIEELKDIFYHKKKYSMKNENKDVNKETKIKWDVEYKDNRNYFKCRVDHGKSVNVVTQNSFSFDFDLSVGHIFKCSELFHSNEYPIIIIEDRNNGGDPNLAYFMIQLFQMREVERTYSAIRYKENFQKYFDLELEYKDEYVYNPDTCENIYKSNEFYEVSDYYNYSGLNITHKRTNVFVELCPLNRRKAFNSFREKYKDSPYLKKPTDIIIFTDSFSFSSGSTFIKGFQNIGGAILVGYLGNPKIEGIDLFDASQSDSGVNTFENTDISEKLEKLGFVVSIMTFIEVFDDSYQAEFRFPREYKMVPVDYRVDIYSFYSDDVYDEFIEKGKQIHRKFNEDNYCNFNNQKLLLHDERCYNIENMEHTHGGFQCGKNNQWDYNNCIPYYCDIGYSFDQYFKKCVKDCLVDWTTYFIYEDNFTNSYNINKNEKYEFIILNPNNSYYVFESSENSIYNFPKISFIKGYKHVIINNYKKSYNDIELNIHTVNIDIEIDSLKREQLILDKVLFLDKKQMLIFQSENEHTILFNTILKNNDGNKIKYLKYNNTINYQDIVNINNKYFKNYSGNSLIMEKGEIYIFYCDNNKEEIHITINPTETNQNISFNNQQMNYLYLKKGNTYILEFPDSILDLMIKLSRETINSEILNEENKIILNKDNLYYYFENKNKENKKLKIKIDKNDATLEFLYNLTNNNIIENINYEKSKLNLKKEKSILKIPKQFKKINIKFNTANDTLVEYSIFQGYSILPFSHYSIIEESHRIKSKNYILDIIEPYNDNIKLMENEFYIITILIYEEGNLDIEISGEKAEEKKEEKIPENKGLKWYIILLIVLGAILFIGLIILIIIIIRKKRKSSEQIEDKMQSLTQV